MTDLMSRPPAAEAPPAWPPVTPPPSPPQDPFGVGAGSAPPRRNRGRRAAILAAAVALALGSGTAGGFAASELLDRPTATVAEATPATAVSSSTATLSAVVEQVQPSVVTVLARTGQGTAEGSGVILTSDGRVLTNNHVVEGVRGAVTVQLSDGRTVQAQVVRTDATHDLALLQLQGVSGLTAATLGDSSTLEVGDTVLAFGSPLGLTGTVTSGIVSALDRSADDLGQTGLIQTDAPINSGSSGGPLVDTAGRVVGIDVANATTDQNGGSIGIGFAIPINTVVQTILS